MAKKRFTNHQMQSMLHDWLGVHRALLEGIDSARHLIKKMEACYAGFLLRPGADPGAALKVLRVRAGSLDVGFDTTLRLSYGFMTWLADWRDFKEPGSGAPIREARDSLWPAGLSYTRTSYLEEAAHADTTADWLVKHPPVRALLEATSLPDGEQLAELVDQWLAAGKELGQVERESEKAAQQLKQAPRVVYAPFRNRFIQLAELLQANLAEDDDVTDEVRETLLGRMVRLEARMDARAARGIVADPEADPSKPEAGVEDEEEPEVN